ncbi:MAG: hypothetical protein KF773_03430 [Deltaproteobacteria bacterium]|nr:hypothetical protein [Deltaproteobacteria bacterium]
MEVFDPAAWLAKGRELVRQARAGAVEGVELACDVSAWPEPWVAAELLTHDLGSEREIDADIVIFSPNALTVAPVGDVEALVERAERASGGAERVAALEEAWRACFAPELAQAIEAADAEVAAEAIAEPKKKAELERVWAAAAATAPPRVAFAGTWPSKWKDAQRRMRVLYQRPRSPRLAAAALELARRDALPYTSQASQTFWQALAWFIAEQGDVRQLAALEELERRIAQFLHRKELHATDALRAFAPPAPPPALHARIARLAATAAMAAPPASKKPALSLASPDERAVAADQLLQEGDPRGELIAVQERIAASAWDQVTPELVKRQAQLLKRHAKAWCPPAVHRETCVFRGGVPVAGHLKFRSDDELRMFGGSRSLATFETLIVDTSFAMGDIANETIAAFVRSLPNLRTVITTDQAAHLLAHSEPPAPHVECVAIPGRVVVAFDGPGLPNLRRVDAEQVRPRWLTSAWFERLEELGCGDPAAWHELWSGWQHAPAIVLVDHAHLHAQAPSRDTPWELVAQRGAITARPLPGSTADSLRATLGEVPSWRGVAALRVPQNFAGALTATAAKHGITLEPIAPVVPEALGIALEFL